MEGRSCGWGAGGALKSCAGALAAVLSWLPGATHAGEVFRCSGPDGNVSFQQTPCAGAGSRVQVPPINVAEPFHADAELQRRADVRSAVARGVILAGMTAEEVQQVLGLPHAVTRLADARGTRDRLFYRYPDGSSRSVHLIDDQVDAVTTSTGPLRRALQPCYSDLQIRNAGVGAQSSVLPPEERERRRQEAERMARCRR